MWGKKGGTWKGIEGEPDVLWWPFIHIQRHSTCTNVCIPPLSSCSSCSLTHILAGLQVKQGTLVVLLSSPGQRTNPEPNNRGQGTPHNTPLLAVPQVNPIGKELVGQCSKLVVLGVPAGLQGKAGCTCIPPKFFGMGGQAQSQTVEEDELLSTSSI